MSKPSIFSKDYKIKMKKRKRRIVFICFILIFVGANFYFYSRFNKNFDILSMKDFLISVINKKTVNTDKKEMKPEIAKNQQTQTVNQEKKEEEKSYSFKLSDGREFKAIYEEQNDEKKFKNVTGDSQKLDFNISPDAKSIVIYDVAVQNIIFMNSDGVTADISKKVYISTSGLQFTREDTIKNNKDYVWAVNPKFIDNENVAYVSQLPWINSSITKYLWIVNIKNPNNQAVFEKISGSTIVLDKLNDNGLTILIDGKQSYLKPNGMLTSS